MKLPSLSSLIKNSSTTFLRFPLAILSAAKGTAVAMLLLHLDFKEHDTHEYYWHILMVSYLGMLLFTFLTIFSERKNYSSKLKIIVQACGVVLLLAYYFSLPEHVHVSIIIRYVLYVIALHLSIAFAPFMVKGEYNGFWQYNKIIFIRILTTALYTGVLYAGIALAILAVDQLFKVDIDEETYGDLWFFLAGVFNTWFFLAGVPRNYSELDLSTDYPKGLKIFTQYVLLPLVTLYLIILYAYEAKIFITADWPVGWVAYLVLGFSIAGILSLLLVWPVRNDEGQAWIKTYSRFFYFALFPLILLLFLAIFKRIAQYGITENRYFILALALWLLFIATYSLLSKVKSIKLIPVSLCIITLLTSFGPWGAFSVSKRSQLNHFEELMIKNNLLKDGKVVQSDSKINWDDQKELSSVIDYLVEINGYNVMQPYLAVNLDSLFKSNSTERIRYSYSQTQKIVSLMNLKYVSRWEDEENYNERISYHSENDDVLNISGYDELVSGYSFYNYTSERETTICSKYTVRDNEISICFSNATQLLTIDFGKSAVINADVMKILDSLQSKHFKVYSLPKGEMSYAFSNDVADAKIILKSIDGEKKDGKTKITNLQADVLLKWKKEKENEVGEKK